MSEGVCLCLNKVCFNKTVEIEQISIARLGKDFVISLPGRCQYRDVVQSDPQPLKDRHQQDTPAFCRLSVLLTADAIVDKLFYGDGKVGEQMKC